ncbi:MAG: amino acid transporter [Desulfuromonas sp.]|nr:MAG: amino acid transporter [Desulfuromonas sp.]
MTVFLQGFGVGAGLIVAIGAQNAFVLAQGARRNYPFQTAFVCSLSDALLILLGVAGLGGLLTLNPQLANGMTWFAVAFLLYYGWRAFRASLSGHSLEATAAAVPSRRQLLLTTLAFTFLNPHVYLDTIVLIGGLSGRLPETERLIFGIGAACASCLWFFGLSYGAGLLAPLFRKPLAWRCLDGLVCLTMWGIAWSLLRPVFA